MPVDLWYSVCHRPATDNGNRVHGFDKFWLSRLSIPWRDARPPALAPEQARVNQPGPGAGATAAAFSGARCQRPETRR